MKKGRIAVADRIGSVSYEIRDIVQKAEKIEKTGRKVYYLNIGDPGKFGFRPPAHVREAIVKAIKEDFCGYAPSAGDPELREVVGKREGVSPSDAFITNGLSEGIDMLFQALLNKGDNVLLPSPSYPLYTSKSRVLGGKDNFYPCDENWVPVIDDIRKKINRKTRAIVVINPNNPTGAVYPESVLREIIGIAGEYNLPIIADEIYDKMVFEGKSTNMHKLSRDVPLISGNGISKVYLYPGARVGYLAFHGDGLDCVKDAMQKLCNARLSVNWEMQRGAIAAFTGPQNHIEKTNKELRKRRDLVYKRLNEMKGIKTAKPHGAFYIFPEITDGRWKSDNDFVYSLLEKTGVVVVSGSGFSPVLDGLYFRMVYLPERGILEEALDKMDGFMKRQRV